jgi:CheY-like chemotaxis protein/two-component sensor histidine kinase
LQCGEHLLCVVNDVLDLSKIEAGKIEIEQVDMDLRALLEEVAGLLATRARQKEIELAVAVPPDLDVNVRGDPSRLRQVLVNLVGNAVKFTERGEVVIEAAKVRDSATHVTVRISVRDTGIGIPLDRQAAVFDSFTQADGSTTRTHGGTGLGLTICRQLVLLMGGEIGLQSAPGEGSTFSIELPFERCGGASVQRQGSVERLAGLRVLVVDDSAVNRVVLRRPLEAWGCRVEEATDGHEALQQLQCAGRDDPFALVILDMQMPGLDGVDTGRRMKADPRLAGVPLILLSSVGCLAGEEARKIGFAAVLTKPVRQSVLLERIVSALGDVPFASDSRPATEPADAVGPLDLHVLLAEDNRVNQLVARRLLEKLGCRVDIAEDGRQAVEATARSPYDVILMDVQMPVMDGFEATRSIRNGEQAGERVPIIAMTAHAMEGDRDRCLAAGMDGYVAKPVSASTLADVLAASTGTGSATRTQSRIGLHPHPVDEPAAATPE